MDDCSFRKKDLENLIMKIGLVEEMYQSYMGMWTKCLKADYEQKLAAVIENVKSTWKRSREMEEANEE